MAEENLFDLSGRVALVTGGAQGLGAAIGSMLSRQGAMTVLIDIDLPAAEKQAREIEKETGNLVQAAACDVGDEDQVAELVTRLAAEHGRLDVLVNNAGIHRRVDALAPHQEDVREIFRVNLLGALNMSSAVGGVMVAQGDGTIINISALGGGLVGLGGGDSEAARGCACTRPTELGGGRKDAFRVRLLGLAQFGYVISKTSEVVFNVFLFFENFDARPNKRKKVSKPSHRGT